jgi:hypothetical protein
VAQAAELPLVVSPTVDYTHNTLTISGQNFGSSQAVTLDALAFQTESNATGQIVANFPSSRTPASFAPGTYLLKVTLKNQLPAIFAVDIGASGAQGPAGSVGTQGAQGLPSVAGAPGPAGRLGKFSVRGASMCGRTKQDFCSRTANCPSNRSPNFSATRTCRVSAAVSSE